MRCFFCGKTDDIAVIDYICLYNTDVCICEECETQRTKLISFIKTSHPKMTLDLYRVLCHYEIPCNPPENASLLDIFCAMDS